MNAPTPASLLPRDEILRALSELGEDPKMSRVDQLRERIDAATLPEVDREAAVRTAVNLARQQLDAGAEVAKLPAYDWNSEDAATARVWGWELAEGIRDDTRKLELCFRRTVESSHWHNGEAASDLRQMARDGDPVAIRAITALIATGSSDVERHQLKLPTQLPEAGFTYQLLGRLQQDCDYYLGAGNRNKKHLWALDEQAQIDKMRELYDQLPEKPEWLTLQQIDQYSTRMLRPPEKELSSNTLEAPSDTDAGRKLPATLPADPERMNGERAAWAAAALKTFREATRCDQEDAVADLLANLMHHCDRAGLAFEHELERARGHYSEETYEAPRSDGASVPGMDM